MYDAIIFASIPIFLLLIAIEWGVDVRRGTRYIPFPDAYGSLALGVWSMTTKLVLLGFGGWFYQDVLGGYMVFDSLGSQWFIWVIAFVLYDLCYYWFHRTSHEINLLWASHSIHHQSEEYNLTTALRQTSSGLFGFIFYLPLYIIGFPFEMIATVGAINLVYQFWVHTRHIDRLGWFDGVFVSPSNHRVHHGQNAEYIDKNHGGVFIIWDRIFGTYQVEDDQIDTVFGVRRQLRSLSPLEANLQVWKSLFMDALHTRSLLDKLKIWFASTGWRPADVEVQHPIAKIPVSEHQKYQVQPSTGATTFAAFQLALATVLGTVFSLNYIDAPYLETLLVFIMVSAPLVTAAWILQGAPKAYLAEYLRSFVSILCCIYLGFDGIYVALLCGWMFASALAVGGLHFVTRRAQQAESIGEPTDALSEV